MIPSRMCNRLADKWIKSVTANRPNDREHGREIRRSVAAAFYLYNLDHPKSKIENWNWPFEMAGLDFTTVVRTENPGPGFQVYVEQEIEGDEPWHALFRHAAILINTDFFNHRVNKDH